MRESNDPEITPIGSTNNEILDPNDFCRAEMTEVEHNNIHNPMLNGEPLINNVECVLESEPTGKEEGENISNGNDQIDWQAEKPKPKIKVIFKVFYFFNLINLQA